MYQEIIQKAMPNFHESNDFYKKFGRAFYGETIKIVIFGDNPNDPKKFGFAYKLKKSTDAADFSVYSGCDPEGSLKAILEEIPNFEYIKTFPACAHIMSGELLAIYQLSEVMGE